MKLLLLAVVLVGCECWKLPTIPDGKRSQYYTQQSDGTYQFGYDTDHGLFHQQEASNDNEVKGSFGSPQGTVIYTSGVDGYQIVANAEHLTSDSVEAGHSPVVQVEQSSLVEEADDSVAQGESAGSAGHSQAIVTSLQQQHQQPAEHGGSHSDEIPEATLDQLLTHPVQVEDTPEVARAKKEFHAAYQAAAQAAADVSHLTEAAVSADVPEIGSAALTVETQPESSALPQPVQDTPEVMRAKEQFQAAYNEAAAAAELAPDVDIHGADGHHSAQPHDSVCSLNHPHNAAATASHASNMVLDGSQEAAVQEEVVVEPAEIIQYNAVHNGDGSYEFMYETPDIYHRQSADALNNVQGAYEYVGDDSEKRRVEYRAGSDIGFVVSADHLPVQVDDTDEVKAAKAAFRAAYEAAENGPAAGVQEDHAAPPTPLFGVPGVASISLVPVEVSHSYQVLDALRPVGGQRPLVVHDSAVLQAGHPSVEVQNDPSDNVPLQHHHSHGDASSTYTLDDGVMVMVAQPAFSPEKYGYTFQ